MAGMNFDDAYSIASSYLKEFDRKSGLGELVIIRHAVVEAADAWYFPFDSAAFAVGKEKSAALAGNIPIQVPRNGGPVGFKMPPEVLYFGLLDDDDDGNIVGIIRRTHTLGRPVDESFGRDSTWKPTEFLHKYKLGHNDTDYKPITAQQAHEIIEQWRVKWAQNSRNAGPPCHPEPPH